MNRTEDAFAAGKPLTIGAVVELLKEEFEDVSISKVRYLEDEKLVSPRRTPGGYRLYSKADVERLRTILTLQRDEFLPLKVIRKELSRKATVAVSPGGSRRFRKISLKSPPSQSRSFSFDEALETSGAEPELVRELEEYGLIVPVSVGGHRQYDSSDVEIMAAASDLARFGVQARNLRTLKSSVDRESALLLQVLEPALRSKNSSTREQGIDGLEKMAMLASHLKHLLLIRDLRKHITG